MVPYASDSLIVANPLFTYLLIFIGVIVLSIYFDKLQKKYPNLKSLNNISNEMRAEINKLKLPYFMFAFTTAFFAILTLITDFSSRMEWMLSILSYIIFAALYYLSLRLDVDHKLRFAIKAKQSKASKHIKY